MLEMWVALGAVKLAHDSRKSSIPLSMAPPRTVGSFLGKIERTLSWVSWLIGYLPKSEGASIT